MTSKEKVLSVYPDADAYRNRFLAKWFIYRDSNPDVNIGEGVCLSEAWDDTASKLPSVPSPAGEKASEPWDGHNYIAPEEGHGRWGCRICGYAIDWHRAPIVVPEPVFTEGAAHLLRCPRCSIVDGVYCDEWNKLQPTTPVAAPVAPAAVIDALRKLAAEVRGWLDLEPVMLARVFGNTNVAVMHDRLALAESALPAPPSGQGEVK